jgi:hypothetical protein
MIMFPHARRVIKARARLLYGSLSHLASQTGISRSALNFRIGLAEESPLTHYWFEFVLCLPDGSLSEDVDAETLARRPSPADAAYAVAASDAAWKARKMTKGETE